MAHFFLSKLRGRSNGFNDLYTLDKELHRSLSILKRYQGDVSAMGLTFTVTKDVAGYRREEELEQGGRNTPVSNENKNRYVRKVAHYKLNSQIEEQSKAFLRGFKSLISPGWLHMFNEEEIQMLISGSLRGALDIDDMRVRSQILSFRFVQRAKPLRLTRSLGLRRSIVATLVATIPSTPPCVCFGTRFVRSPPTSRGFFCGS